MALFDRDNYDRDYNRWGGSPEYGGRGRGDWGGRHEGGHGFRGMWNRVTEGVRDAFGGDRDYDRDYGRGRMGAGGHDYGGDYGNTYRGDRGWSQGGHAGLGYRGLDEGWSTVRNHGRYDEGILRGGERDAWGGGYDRGYGARRGMQGGQMYGGGRHLEGGTWSGRDRMEGGMRHDRDRLQTDAGDPFGDRQSRTPFRVMRGGFDTPETDRGGWYQGNQLNRVNRDRGDRYDVEYRGWNQGLGDEPGFDLDRGDYDRSFRDRNRGGRWF